MMVPKLVYTTYLSSVVCIKKEYVHNLMLEENHVTRSSTPKKQLTEVHLRTNTVNVYSEPVCKDENLSRHYVGVLWCTLKVSCYSKI